MDVEYLIRKKDDKATIFTEDEYFPPLGYLIETTILETSNHSVPICRLIPKNATNSKVIIYAHGNASDMSDSLAFVEKMASLLRMQYIIFDYTGYGESRVFQVGEEIIKDDLEIVLAWLTKNTKLSDIILWGFSLGSFPVVVNASKYKVGGVILQCPIASVSCLFHEKLHPEMSFKDDHFANIDHMAGIKSKIMILHSSGDEIIPF